MPWRAANDAMAKIADLNSQLAGHDGTTAAGTPRSPISATAQIDKLAQLMDNPAWVQGQRRRGERLPPISGRANWSAMARAKNWRSTRTARLNATTPMGRRSDQTQPRHPDADVAERRPRSI